jgi:hypothetical protein
MIDALIGGSITSEPQQKTSAGGKPYVQCKLRVPQGDGDAMFVLLTAFDPDVCRALLAHGVGDSIAATGTVKLGTWTPPNGGDARVNIAMIVSGVLSAYAVRRRRDAMREQGRTQNSNGTRTSSSGGSDFHDDALGDAF